jgi:hypothetical protein
MIDCNFDFEALKGPSTYRLDDEGLPLGVVDMSAALRALAFDGDADSVADLALASLGLLTRVDFT